MIHFRKPNYIIIGILICIVMIELAPYVITVISPDLCYGCTSIGKLQQKLNNEYNTGYIAWFSYILLFLYIIYLATNLKNQYLKYITIIVCIYLIYLPTLPLLSVMTVLLSMYFKNPPFIHNYHTIFPSSTNIEKSANTIINEFNTYLTNNKIECIRKTNPGFKIENTNSNENCWRALYLKKIGVIDQQMIKHFPNTIKLVEDEQIHNAFFSILDPGVEIPSHVGYYKGYLRYHMGIEIPNNNTGRTDDKAYIVCGDEKYIWKEGEGIVFDDMYLHYVKNPTNQTRVVLYLDVKRKSENPFINFINNAGIYLLENSILLKTFLKNQHNQNKITEL